MNSSIPIKMVFLIRRQFIEWSPAVLAAEISKGLQPERPKMLKYLQCRSKIVSDNIFVEKFIQLIPFCWIMIAHVILYIDRLPYWMFIKFITIINAQFHIYSMSDYIIYIMSHVNNIDNILFCLSAGMNAKCISWDHVYPLDRLWVLRSWFLLRQTDIGGLYYDKQAIMGIEQPKKYTFREFKIVKNILKYGDGISCVWIPCCPSDYNEVTPFYLNIMLKKGWFIIINMERLRVNPLDLYAIHRAMVKNKCQYQLYDLNFIYGQSNRSYYRAIREIDVSADIERNRAPYDQWLRFISLNGLKK